MLKCSSLRTNESNRSSSIRSDCASVPTRGSKFAGLNSMAITSVSGAGRLEQDSIVAHNTKSINHRGHEGTRRYSFWLVDFLSVVSLLFPVKHKRPTCL